MPLLKEAAALVAGTVIGIEDVPEYDDKGNPTGRNDGIKCLVQTGDGYASVKLRPAVANEVRPTIGQFVAWFARWGVLDSGRGYSSFVRVAAPGDVHHLASIVGVKVEAPKAAA